MLFGRIPFEHALSLLQASLRCSYLTPARTSILPIISNPSNPIQSTYNPFSSAKKWHFERPILRTVSKNLEKHPFSSECEAIFKFFKKLIQMSQVEVI